MFIKRNGNQGQNISLDINGSCIFSSFIVKQISDNWLIIRMMEQRETLDHFYLSKTRNGHTVYCQRHTVRLSVKEPRGHRP